MINPNKFLPNPFENKFARQFPFLERTQTRWQQRLLCARRSRIPLPVGRPGSKGESQGADGVARGQPGLECKRPMEARGR